MVLVYDATGRDGMSREVAEIILQKEVKVPSSTIGSIKSRMKEKLSVPEPRPTDND